MFWELMLLIVGGGVLLLLYFSSNTSNRIGELERRVEALGAELQALRSGGVRPPPLRSRADRRDTEVAPASADAGASAPTPDDVTADEAQPAIAALLPPEQVSAPAAAAAEPPRADLESLIGGRWSVILGGIAVALGALFLVRYSIEAGLLGPAARTAAGAALAVGLLAAGEFLRRKDKREDLAPFLSADIPGVLTGAGAVAAFGTLFAAHAIYGFVGPAVAFVGLTAIGIACLVAASLHGPKLAAIGLLGSYAAPLLVSSQAPNHLALALHTLVVTASAMTAARIRGWLWLAIGGVVGSLLWTLILLISSDPDVDFVIALLVVGLALIYAAAFAWQVDERNEPPLDAPADIAGTGSFIALAVVTALAVAVTQAPLSAIIAAAVGLVTIAAAYLRPALCRAAPWAAAGPLMLGLAIDFREVVNPGIVDDRPYQGIPVPPDVAAYVATYAFGAVPVALAAIYAAWRVAAAAPRLAGQFAIAASLIFVLGMVISYLRISGFDTSVPSGAAALALAILSVTLTELLGRARPDDWKAPAPAAFAVAAVALIALAMGMVMTKVWLPFGIALTSAGVAWIFGRRPVAALPILAVILAALAASGLWFNAPFAGEAIGTTPFFNRLILIAGLPALALLLAGEWLARDRAGLWAALQTAIGLGLLAFFVALELRHFITGGEIASPEFGLADMAVQSIAALGFAIGLQYVARWRGAGVYDWGSLVAGAAGIVMLIFGLGIAFNPYITGDETGTGAVFNLLLPGYLVPGVLAGVVFLLSKDVRPLWYRIGYGLAAGLLLFLYATLMTRHAFQGNLMGSEYRASDAEFWAYSVVWLSIGGLLLAAGLYFRSLPLRMASAALILLTVFKVFLLDMSALTGPLRAFSFIGLGLSLLVIGRFYQRILMRTGNRAPPPAAPAAGPPGLPPTMPEGPANPS